MVYKHAYSNILLLLHSTLMLCLVKMPLKGEFRGSALNYHGDYIVDNGKSWNCVFEFLWEACEQPFPNTGSFYTKSVSLQTIKHLMSFEHATFSRAKATKMSVLGRNAYSCNVI